MGPWQSVKILPVLSLLAFYMDKPACSSLNETRCIKGSWKHVPPEKAYSNKQKFLSASSTLHLSAYCPERLLGNNNLCPPHPNPTDYGHEIFEKHWWYTLHAYSDDEPVTSRYPKLLNDLAGNGKNSLCDKNCTCFHNRATVYATLWM